MKFLLSSISLILLCWSCNKPHTGSSTAEIPDLRPIFNSNESLYMQRLTFNKTSLTDTFSKDEFASFVSKLELDEIYKQLKNYPFHRMETSIGNQKVIAFEAESGTMNQLHTVELIKSKYGSSITFYLKSSNYLYKMTDVITFHVNGNHLDSMHIESVQNAMFINESKYSVTLKPLTGS